MARRLGPTLEDHLRRSQYCAVPGNSIFDAVSTVRDAIKYSETSRTPLCVLTLGFESVFDGISHRYMFDIIGRYGISPLFIERILTLYDGSYASVQITGILTGHIPIQCLVRKGCPLRMVLDALRLHPLLCTLEIKLTGIHIRSTERSSPVVAYADDVTVLVTRPEDFDSIQQSVAHFKRATGARLNKNRTLLRMGTGRHQRRCSELTSRNR